MPRLDDLLTWYAALTPQSLARIGEFYAADAVFKDPFNTVRGLPAITGIYTHMFRTTEAPRFIIRERIVQADQAFVTWDFSFTLKGRQYNVVGGTHFHFDAQGLVIDHRDYWDAAEELWQKLPLIGGMVRWLRGKFRSQA